MTLSVVTDALVRLHQQIQQDCGHSSDAVTPDCCPLDDLPDFDSLLVPSTIRKVARELGSPLPKGTKIKNIYVSQDGKTKRTIREVANAFIQSYSPGSDNR